MPDSRIHRGAGSTLRRGPPLLIRRVGQLSQRDDRLDLLIRHDGVDPSIPILGDRQIVDVSSTTSLSEHGVQKRVDEHVAATNPQPCQQALGALASLTPWGTKSLSFASTGLFEVAVSQ